MKIIYCMFLESLLIAGCASTVELNSVDEANMEIGNRSAIVYTKSGQEYNGRDVQVGTDSVRMINIKTEDTLQLSNRDIILLKVTNHPVGCRDGFLVGGAFLGTTIFIIGSVGIHSDEKPDMDRRMITAFTAIGAGIGGVLGLAIGGISGHHYTYILPKDSVKVAKETFIDSTSNSNHQLLKSAP